MLPVMRLRSFLIAVLLLFGSSTVHARSLYWSSIDVDARIDRDGVMEVSETQAYVFDGDWNGGERSFRIRPGQSLQVLGVDRIDGQKVVALRSGNLSEVDQYQVMDGNVLRWRSRLPSDPEFESTPLTYRIRYRLHGVLRGRNGEYSLKHDFLFPDRTGVVERFSMRLTTSPAWRGIEPVVTGTAKNLQPGEGFVVTRTLIWKGRSQPAAVTNLPSPALGQAVMFLLVLGIATLAFTFFLREKERGRFGGITPLSEIDDAWLQNNILEFSPEAIGAAWDGKVGAAEVAAAIASLAQQKKIETTVEKRMLRRSRLKMRLTAGDGEIAGHHGAILRKLFFNRRKETDTDAIRKHYRKTGLDLAALIRSPIESELQRIPRWTAEVKVFDWRIAAGALAAGIVLMIAIAFKGGNDAALVSVTMFFGFIATVGSTIAAKVNANALTRIPLRFAIVFAFVVPLLVVLFRYLSESSDYLFGLPAMLACAASVVALFHLVFNLLRTTDSDQKIAFRKKVISARRYLREQLRAAQPRLRDDWFPYLLALGLGRNVDSWFRAHAKSSSALGGSSSTSFGSSSSVSSTGSSAGSSWTGGGGSFGGAGATASWAVAAAAMGAGVSAPSSGSSGGGGSSSSSSSSSGGGGGGGW